MTEEGQTPLKNNLTKRIGWITLGSLIFLALFLNINAYLNALKQERNAQSHNLRIVAKSVASLIDGDGFERVIGAYQQKGTYIYEDKDPDFLHLQKVLKTVQSKFEINYPIYTVSKYENNKGLFYGPSSKDQPVFQNTYHTAPQRLIKNYDEGGFIEGKESGRGKWFSAMEPIRNGNGKVVGAVLVDHFDNGMGGMAAGLLLKNVTVSVAVIIIMALFLNKFLNRVVHIMKARRKAEQMALVKAKFLSTMSHEIRTPMNAVIGLTNILLQENPRPDQSENLNTLKFSADLLLSLINDILDYSKIEAGKISIESYDFDLHLLINNIRNAMRSKAEEKNLRFETSIDPEIPAMVNGDQVRLSQILTNLTANAIKFTNQGEVLIDLHLLEKNEKEITIRFAVKDTGIGIPKDKFETIFQSFSQADTDTTRKFGGTGLGLSITKKLLNLQNSDIKLESELGKGSTFFFDLTFKTATELQPAIKVETPASNFESFNGSKILLVEDNQINVLVAKKFLNKWQLNIDTAENGEIALEMVQNEDYKLVLMDLEMPVMDGYTATRKIRELQLPKYKKLPIIALSASAISDYRTKALHVGMDEFVTKPFNPGELHSVISRFLSNAS